MSVTGSVKHQSRGRLRPRVMIFGDSELSARELASLLEDTGLEIALVRGTGRLDRIGATLPSAIVIEEQADRGGWELSSRIRRKSDVPIILVGESDSEVSWVKAAAYGIDCYMARPFGSRELAARIKTLVRRYDGTLRGFAKTPEGWGGQCS